MGRISAAKHEEYAQGRRDSILTAALRVFARAGFAEAKMEEVAAAAGLSKAALYLYFPSKDAVLQSLLKRYVLLPELPEMVAALKDTPPAIGIPTLIAQIWRLLLERKELARLVVREIQSNPERARLFAEHVGQPASQSLANYLDHWAECGVLKRQDMLVTAKCLFGMLWFFLLTQELMGGKDRHPLSDEAILTTVARIFLEGAANDDSRPATRADASKCEHKVPKINK